MLIIFDKCTNPYSNLASEEFLLKNTLFTQPVIRIWQNSPAVIVGKFQNTLSEINSDYIKENDIAVVRRTTGGGAVYHDLGNINYTIAQPTSSQQIDFSLFTKPIIELLADYGIAANNKGRNDIEIADCKISGGAQTISNNRILHHGTLLFSVNLDTVSLALQAKESKLKAKGVQSIRARIGNIVDFMKQPISTEQFMQDLESYFSQQPNSQKYFFSASDNQAIEQLLEEKYNTWQWNYGNSPDYNRQTTKRYAWGELTILLLIKENHIKDIHIYGDFFSQHEVQGEFQKLIGTEFSKEALSAKIEQIELWQTIANFTKEELIDQLLSAQ